MTEIERVGRRGRWGRSERGQAVILFVGFFTVVLLIAAIVVDFGLWLAERRAVQQVADLSALAGSQDLLVDDDAAITNALEWAARNGFVDGVDGVEVTVELLCKNTLSDPPAGVCTNGNPPGSGPSACQAGGGCDSLRVLIRKPADRLFTPIFGIGEVEVSAGAAAGLAQDVVAADTVMLLDASGSMSEPPCNPQQIPQGCPLMTEARDAASGLVDLLVSGGEVLSQVGYAPYNHCYNPPQARATAKCVPAASVVDLTVDGAALHAVIDATTARGATNVCISMLKAQELFDGPRAQSGAGVRRSVLLLSDGDNHYSSSAYDALLNYPPPECRPPNPSTTENTLQRCQPSSTQDRELDLKTYRAAERLKSQGIEIFVVGFDVCGPDDGRTAWDAGYCAGIGDGAHDRVADQRLLKCVASAPDHYFRVSSAEDLPGVFQAVAGKIISRGLFE